MKRTTPILLLTFLASLLLVPAASAHATYPTEDGAYNIVVGYQGEPVYTYQATGLDLIIRTADGDPVEGVNATLNATLISPSGEELSLPLKVQFGETGRYEFTEGFVLTEPGLYKLRLVGDINGSPVEDDYAMKHATKPRSDIMFPAGGDDVPELQERIAALEAQQAELESKLAERDENKDADATSGEASAPAFTLGLLAVALVAFLARRR